MNNLNNHKYILNAIGRGDKYWRCEVCGGDTLKMFFQIELHKTESGKWTCHDCRNLLGHKVCLETMQKGGEERK
jgi:hypothetical protein